MFNENDKQIDILSRDWKTTNSLFTKEELKFFYELSNYIKGKKVLLFSKVRMADLIKKKHYIESDSDYFEILNKITNKHIDYLLTDFKGKILCLIELDGDSHLKLETEESDEFKDDFSDKLNIKLKRFKNYEKHDLSVLDEYILKA